MTSVVTVSRGRCVSKGSGEAGSPAYPNVHSTQTSVTGAKRPSHPILSLAVFTPDFITSSCRLHLRRVWNHEGTDREAGLEEEKEEDPA